MRDLIRIGSVRLTPAPEAEAGLLGEVSCVLNGRILLGCIALSRRRDGTLVLAFPERVTHTGQALPLVRPVGCGTRELLEQQVISALRGQGVVP